MMIGEESECLVANSKAELVEALLFATTSGKNFDYTTISR